MAFLPCLKMVLMSSSITTRRAFVGYDKIDVGIITRFLGTYTKVLPNLVSLQIPEVRCKDYTSLDRKPL